MMPSRTSPQIDAPSQWLLYFVLALGVQFLLLWLLTWTGSHSAPQSFSVTSMDAASLADLKRRWSQANLPPIFSAGPASTETDEAPTGKERYSSDRAHRVEREQRAARHATLPQRSRSQTEALEHPQSKPRSLAPLGIPLPAPQEARRELRANASEDRDQAISDDLPVGSENLLNTTESLYYSFFERASEKLVPFWTQSIRAIPKPQWPSFGAYTTEALITMDEEGAIEKVTLLKESGIKAYDQSVLTAIRRSLQFQNPPRGLRQADGQYQFAFRFTVRIEDTQGFEFMPPSRIESMYF